MSCRFFSIEVYLAVLFFSRLCRPWGVLIFLWLWLSPRNAIARVLTQNGYYVYVTRYASGHSHGWTGRLKVSGAMFGTDPLQSKGHIFGYVAVRLGSTLLFFLFGLVGSEKLSVEMR